jgi:hypothetical protein
MMTKSAPLDSAAFNAGARRLACADTTAGFSSFRRSFHLDAVACGSRSMTATVCPAAAAATASPSATVVLPVPPFWPTSEVTNMFVTSVSNYRSFELTNDSG